MADTIDKPGEMLHDLREKYDRLAKIRDEGMYIVVVARVDDGKVIFSRPGSTLFGHAPSIAGPGFAETQLKVGMTAVDRYFDAHGGEGESFETFMGRFR